MNVASSWFSLHGHIKMYVNKTQKKVQKYQKHNTAFFLPVQVAAMQRHVNFIASLENQ
jgi:hypothetical protein